jgi:MSHA biogenesis protein MshO
MKTRGFTLLELLMVIVITGILAAVLTVFLRPAIDSYLETQRRANLSDMADTALRRVAQELRSAVPNSIRMVNSSCFQFVPTTSGGRYRMATDVALPASFFNSPVDTSMQTTQFDVLNRPRTVPSVGDWVVVNNQNSGDVYAGNNRSQIIEVGDLSTSDLSMPNYGGLAVGFYRLKINALQFPVGYDQGRFVVVSNNAQSVFYSCNGGFLYRTAGQFDSTNLCAPTVDSRIVASNAQACTFVYQPNASATQQSGYLRMTMTLTDHAESVTLVHGIHVENAP